MPKGVYIRREFSKHSNCRGDDIELMFWKRVNKSGPIHPICGRCWQWMAGKTWQGYGQFRGLKASRVAWELCKGEIPDGMFVLHHCDNTSCVNPKHLFLGTGLDNMQDMVVKGRWRGGRTSETMIGEKNPKAKMTARHVLKARELYSRGWPIRKIHSALQCPVGLCCLRMAIVGKIWKHL